MIHDNGDSTGPVGASPANGFSTAPATSAMTAVTMATGSCTAGADGTVDGGVSLRVLVVGVIATTGAAVTSGVGAGSATTSDSATEATDGVVCERTLDVLAVTSAAGVNPPTRSAVLPDDREALDRFVLTDGATSLGVSAATLRSVEDCGVSVSEPFDFGECFASESESESEAAGVAPEPVSGSSLVLTPVVDEEEVVADDPEGDPTDDDDPVDDDDDVDVDPLLEPVDVDEFADDAPEDESDPEPSEGAADATPWPTTTAAPTPNATASPPIRPTYAPLLMGNIGTPRTSHCPRFELITDATVKYGGARTAASPSMCGSRHPADRSVGVEGG